MTARRLAALVSFAVPLCLSLSTLCPAPYWLDSGELIAAASSLGVAHPSGYPLYVLLGRLFSVVPAGEIAQRIAGLSAFAAAAASLFLYLGCLALTGSVLASLAASLTAAVSLSLWDVSNTAEVYALNMMFAALAAFLLVRIARGPGLPRNGCLLAYAFGLGMTNHLTLGSLLPSALLLFVFGERERLRAARATAPLLLAFFLLGLSLYLFLPIRAALDPPLNWGDPASAGRLVRHVTLSSQGGYFFSRSAEEVRGMFTGIGDFYVDGFGLPAIILALAGFLLLLRRDVRFFLILVLPVAILTFFVVNFGTGAKMAEEQEFFYLPSAIFTAFFMAVALGQLERFARAKWPSLPARVLTGLLFLAVPLLPATVNYGKVDKSEDRSAMTFARHVNESMEKPALLLTDHTSLAFLFTYAQVVEKKWNDAPVIYLPLLREEWYRRKLGEMRPDLVLAMGEGGSNLASLVGENDARFTIYAHQAHPKKSIPSDYLLPAGPVMRVGLAPPVIDRKVIESHRRILAPLEADSAALANSHYRANLGVIDLTSAAIFARAGFPEDAVLEARKALSLDPQSPAPYLMLAEVRERQGIAEEASTLYRAALEREPGNDAAMVRLGALTEKAGDSGEARALYERAIGVNERSGPAHAMLGLLLFRSGGDNEKALFHLERALALGAGSDDVQRAIGELQSMREVK